MTAAETLTEIYDRIRKVRRPRRPARLLAAAAVVLAVSGCGSLERNAVQRDEVGQLREWEWDTARGVSTVCTDAGDRLYWHRNGFAAVANGCEDPS